MFGLTKSIFLHIFHALGHPLPWAISFFFFLDEKKINIFRLMNIALLLKVTY